MDGETNGSIRCDICHKEHLFEPGRIVSGIFALPDGWFMLFRGEYKRHLVSPIFCSVDCLAQWAEQQRSEEQIRAWEAAHPDIDCRNRLMHPYFEEQMIASLRQAKQKLTEE